MRDRPDPIVLVLDEAFVAAALVHEPSAAERAGHGRVAPRAVVVGWTNLQVYLAAVGALLVLLLTSTALDRALG